MDDYGFAERQTLEREEQNLRRFWAKHLAGARVDANPFLRAGEGNRTGTSGVTDLFRISTYTTERLKRIAAERGTTLFNVLLAVFKTLIARHTGAVDVTVSSPAHRRMRSDLQNQVGYLVNPVLLRSKFSMAKPFADLVREVAQGTAQAIAHSALPATALAEIRGAPSGMRTAEPLCPIQFVFQRPQSRDIEPLLPLMFEVPERRVLIGGIELESAVSPIMDPQCDLSLSMCEAEGEIAGRFHFDRGIFSEQAVRRLVAHFINLAQSASARPRTALGSLTMLTPEERHLHTRVWNNITVPLPEPALLHVLFERQAGETPFATALEAGEAKLSYRELNTHANAIALALRRVGAKNETVVGLCAERSQEMIAGLIGILKAGATYMPLDPSFPRQRIELLLQESGAVAVLAEPELVDGICTGRTELVDLKAAYSRLPAEPLEESEVDGANSAYVIFTSGSTGVPKGAVNTHIGICNRVLWWQRSYPLGPGDRVLHKTPLTFDVSIPEIFQALISGATLVLAPPGAHREMGALRNLIRHKQITVIHFVPSILRAFLDDGGMQSCESIRLMVCSGEALGRDLQDRVLRDSRAELVNLYGPTEASVDVTSWSCRPDFSTGPIPIGRAIDNVSTYVLDEDYGLCPTGASGWLYIGGIAPCRGYLRRPDLTAEAFVPDPVTEAAGGRLYRTGDLASYGEDGIIYYLGRSDSQIKIRGVRVELAEIENTLLEHPDVRQCSVWISVAAPDEFKLHACVAPASQRWDPYELTEYLRTRLPYDLLAVCFARIDEFPCLSNGKLDRAALKQLQLPWETPCRGATAPQTQTEQAIAEIWSQLLGHPCPDIHTNFFAVGGHSMLAAKLLVELQQRLGVEVPLQSMFGGPATIAELAARADELRYVEAERFTSNV